MKALAVVLFVLVVFVPVQAKADMFLGIKVDDTFEAAKAKIDEFMGSKGNVKENREILPECSRIVNCSPEINKILNDRTARKGYDDEFGKMNSSVIVYESVVAKHPFVSEFKIERVHAYWSKVAKQVFFIDIGLRNGPLLRQTLEDNYGSYTLQKQFRSATKLKFNEKPYYLLHKPYQWKSGSILITLTDHHSTDGNVHYHFSTASYYNLPALKTHCASQDEILMSIYKKGKKMW